MNRITILLLAFVLATACGRSDVGTADEHGHADTEAFERGPHNGRLLEQDDFAVEIAIYEAGVPPEYRVWLYEDDKPLPPSRGDRRSRAHSGSAASANASRFVRKATTCAGAASSQSRIRSMSTVRAARGTASLRMEVRFL